jgi:acetoacetate decarboxylase
MELVEVIESAYAMPRSSPSYPCGPYHDTNREHMVVTYRTSREALERVVPKPLEFSEPIVKYEFIRMPDSTGFGDYTESGQVMPASFGGAHGDYVHAMYLDDDPPIAGGRELWGFPKKLAAPTLRVERDTLLGTLNFSPVRIATGSMGYKHEALDHATALQALSKPAFLLKIIPHVDGSPRICEIVRYQFGDINLKGAWSAPAALELHPHALAPVNDLPVLEVLSAVHLIADLTLNLSEVAYDYLAG